MNTQSPTSKETNSKQVKKHPKYKETYRHKYKYTPTHLQLLNQVHKLSYKHPTTNNIDITW
jgi:hypothetical protein